MSQPAIDTARTSERLSAFLSKIDKNEPVDQTFVELPTLSMLMQNRDKGAHGRQCVIPLDTARNSTIKSFADNDTFETTVPDTARVAVYAMKNYGGVVAWHWEEVQETKNSDLRIFEIVKHRRNNALMSLKDLLNADLYALAVGAKDINSLPLVVSTSRSLGGIDSSANSYWDAQETTGVGAFATNGIANMRSMCNDIKIIGHGKVKNIVTTQSVYEDFENELDPDVRYSQTKKLERGADSLFYKGAEVEFDDDVPTGHMYFLNPDWLKLKVDSAADFSFGKVMEGERSFTFVSKFVFRGQVVSAQPRALGRLTGIT
jgi:hypothetical protein